MLHRSLGITKPIGLGPMYISFKIKNLPLWMIVQSGTTTMEENVHTGATRSFLRVHPEGVCTRINFCCPAWFTGPTPSKHTPSKVYELWCIDRMSITVSTQYPMCIYFWAQRLQQLCFCSWKGPNAKKALWKPHQGFLSGSPVADRPTREWRHVGEKTC